jgi:hypothetical protein
VKFHESFLDDVLGRAMVPEQAKPVVEERRFQGREEFLNGFPSGRFRAGFVWGGHGHACWI